MKTPARLSLAALLLGGSLGAQLSFQTLQDPSALDDPHFFPSRTGVGGPFQRIATFPVFLNTSVDEETVAEIVAASEDGNLLVYTDSATEQLGFVDITDPYNPLPDGVLPLPGEPTSVAVRGDYALVCVNTSADFVNTSGELLVVDLQTRGVVRSLALGGQPDAVAISPDGRYAAVAIENERDEDLGEGEPPQAPPGFVVIVDLVGAPANWITRTVDLVGIPHLYPEDPEPEFIDINALNVAVVTCQENNHIVLIALSTGQILNDFPAGTVDLDRIDIAENDLIEPVDALQDVPREPDAVAWTSLLTFATADEGDLFGGSRGFTNFGVNGAPLFEAGNSVERLVTRIGHYPEGRSENKGNEPEGIEFGRYGNQRFLFVGSERSSVVAVYQMLPLPLGATRPVLRQVLPTGVAPEGLLAIPERDLFVVSCEEDSREDKIRSSIVLYARTGQSTYPKLISRNRPGNVSPIPWGALSALATPPNTTRNAFTVHDSFYRRSRIFRVDLGRNPAVITAERELRDDQGLLLDALESLKAQLPGTDDFDPTDIVEADGAVNLDAEALAWFRGGFWVASEGAGNLVDGVSDPDDRPFETPNLLVRVAASGRIQEVVLPPIELTRNQLRFGYEGVAAIGPYVYVCFQRAWQAAGDPSDRARIGRYDRRNGDWTFAYYPLDAPTSPNGGWVGLSELTYLGSDTFAVLERDDQGGTDATVKRIYTVSVDGVDFRSQGEVFEVLDKSLALDLIVADVFAPTGGPFPEKLEGLAVLGDGTAVIVNDNDGVDDNSGETQLLRLDGLFD